VSSKHIHSSPGKQGNTVVCRPTSIRRSDDGRRRPADLGFLAIEGHRDMKLIVVGACLAARPVQIAGAA